MSASELKAAMEGMEDCKKVHRLTPLADGWWGVWFETPFATFPNHVVLEVSALLESIRNRMRCGAAWGAEEEWNLRYGQKDKEEARALGFSSVEAMRQHADWLAVKGGAR